MAPSGSGEVPTRGEPGGSPEVAIVLGAVWGDNPREGGQCTSYFEPGFGGVVCTPSMKPLPWKCIAGGVGRFSTATGESTMVMPSAPGNRRSQYLPATDTLLRQPFG